jgi:NADH-quinone oxidoreductase subunit K
MNLLLATGQGPVEVTLNSYLFLGALLFAIGFFGVLLRKNTLVIYMCLELMLVAVTLALVAFSRYNGTMDGNVFVFFILTVAAAEVAVGLAIIVALFRRRQTVQVDELNALRN